jgi:hypothetical protein
MVTSLLPGAAPVTVNVTMAPPRFASTKPPTYPEPV